MLDFLEKYHLEDDVVAVGVSGGADSLALALWVNDCFKNCDKKVVALTVDHQLRPESGQEAEYVHQVMSQEGIEHHILSWQGEKPKTGIEEAARLARYQLLSDWCHQRHIRCLCVAHHALDQAETFLMRLQRGSGLTGLCGMQEVSELNGLLILRPFLKKNPEDLKIFLKQKNIDWVTDSSNDCDDFLRVRIRKFLPQMEKATGITVQRIVDTMSVLKRSRDYVQGQVFRFIKQHVRFWEESGVSVSSTLLRQHHEEIVYHVLAELIKRVGQSDYTARADDIERLVLTVLNKAEFKGATLGHCEIFEYQGKLWIIPELKQKKRLPKKVWETFCSVYPQYAGLKLPYKLKVVLVKTKMNIEF